MSYRQSVIVLFRSPLKTLVTFLLLAATSFAFISRGAEYVATAGVVGSAENSYVALGTLRATAGAYLEYPLYDELFDAAYMPLSQEAVDLVLSSGYVSSSETRHVAGGTTSNELSNIYEQPLVEGGSYEKGLLPGDHFKMSTGFVIATCTAIEEDTMSIWLDGTHPINAELVVDEVIVGEPSWYSVGDTLELPAIYDGYKPEYTQYWGEHLVDNSEFIDQIQVGHSYFISLEPYYIGQSAHDSFLGNHRSINESIEYPIIDLTRLEAEHGITDWREALSDPEKYGLIEFVGTSSYVREPPRPYDQIIPVLDYMETLERNLHTVELVHTSDMTNLTRVHDDSLYISDGRAITPEDTDHVCVVSANYALRNGLAVGDSIEFTVDADTMLHSGKVFARELPVIDGYISDIFFEVQAFSDHGLEPVDRTYEIVGIWSDTVLDRQMDPYAYSLNTIFVPASTYPWADEVEPRLASSTFSFTLKHPGDVERMQEELGGELAALGYELAIDDMGYAAAQHSLNMMRASALIGFVTMGAALVLALILITYLFIIRRKYDYAIMRALGVPAPQASRTLLVGLLTLSVAAVIVGCVASLVMTQNLSADLSAQLLEITGAEASAATPTWAIPAFGIGTLALLLVFAQIGLVRIGKKAPLALLQGGK